MCTSRKPTISQLSPNPNIGPYSIQGQDTMNGNATMILEFFKAGSGHPTCVGEIILGTRFYYFPFLQLDRIKIALDNQLIIRVKGEEDADGWISRVAWKAV